MRVAIVENTPVTHHGQVGVALNEAGLMIEVFRPRADGRLPDPGGPHAGLVVLGGEQSARDDADYPYLPELARRMRAEAEAGRPVLGICLGAQLLARGAGAANRLGAAPEFGWQEVELTAAGRADPVLSAAGPRFPSFQWHSDTFDLPPGAVHLARGAAVPMQAFRFGSRAWGVQFHFEMSRAVVAQLLRLCAAAVEARAPGWAAGRHAAEAARHGPAADAAGLALARAWVAQL
jgi:GMP synthase-like glutamine amidotransferase